MRLVYVVTFFAILAACSTQSARMTARGTPPHGIILFMVDDMGWQDTSVPFWKDKTPANRLYHTPAMDRLASGGMRFTQAYANQCWLNGRTD